MRGRGGKEAEKHLHTKPFRNFNLLVSNSKKKAPFELLTGLTKIVGVLALLLFEIPAEPGSPLLRRTLHLGFLP